ncbi:MAG TPA: hypothetical protein DCZ76_10905 [Treponema sp.]|nr:hypothetical protein [Treponema sp.]
MGDFFYFKHIFLLFLLDGISSFYICLLVFVVFMHFDSPLSRATLTLRPAHGGLAFGNPSNRA